MKVEMTKKIVAEALEIADVPERTERLAQVGSWILFHEGDFVLAAEYGEAVKLFATVYGCARRAIISEEGELNA